MPFTSASGRAAGKLSRRWEFLAQHLIAELNEIMPDSTGRARMLIRALVNQAIDGNVQAIKEVFDRIEGKAPQPVEHDGEIEHKHSGSTELLLSRIARIASHGSAEGGA